MAIVGLQDYGMAKDLFFWFAAYLKGRVDGVQSFFEMPGSKLGKPAGSEEKTELNALKTVHGIPFTQADWFAINAFDKVKIKVRNDEVVIDLQRHSGK